MNERIRARGAGRSAGRGGAEPRREAVDWDADVNGGMEPASQARRMEERLDESGAPVGPEDPEIGIREEIQRVAYERYLSRHGGPGSAEEDWREAEREVRGKLWNKGSGTEPGI